MHQVVLDTNVLVAALRSRRGASHELVRRLAFDRAWVLNLSNSLALEYIEIVLREGPMAGLSSVQLESFLNFICAAAVEREIHFRWRPTLADPDDDLVLELAVACGATHIITFNKRDFAPAARFGIQIVSPGEFLALI